MKSIKSEIPQPNLHLDCHPLDNNLKRPAVYSMTLCRGWGGLGFMLCHEKTSTPLGTSGCQWHDARPLEYTAK